MLTQVERLDLLGSLLGLAYNYLEAGVAEQLLEALRAMNMLEELMVDSILRSRQEGRAEGRVAGQQHAILHALRKRFGAVASVMQEQIETVHDEQLLALLFDAALDSESLDAFSHLVSEQLPRA